MNKIDYYTLDYYDRNVICMIIDKYKMPALDAMRSFLMSKTHGMLEDEAGGLWAFPERAIFDMWEVEQITGNQEIRHISGGIRMNEELRFFIFLIEKYASEKKRPTGDVLREWDEKGITDKIYDMYFQYHQERLENAFADIDCLMETGEHIDYSAV